MSKATIFYYKGYKCYKDKKEYRIHGWMASSFTSLSKLKELIHHWEETGKPFLAVTIMDIK